MDRIIYFQRNINCGYSINKVTQSILKYINNKEEYYVPASRVSVLNILKNIFYVVRHRDKNNINHITGDIHYCILALIGCKSVLTIHDTVTLDYYKYSWLKAKLIEFFWFVIPLYLADKVVCITEETKQKVQKYTNRKDITVINNPVDEFIIYYEKKEISSIVNVLLIGTNDNKNLLRTIEALGNIVCKVTIIGKLKLSQIQALEKYKIDYNNKFNISDQEIREEYCNCDIVSFCSLFEGFGMPVIEANKAGRVVICSDIPVLNYVAGNAACFVNPYSIDDIKEGFITLISDDKMRNKLIANGIENAKRFDPRNLVQQWEKLYKSI